MNKVWSLLSEGTFVSGVMLWVAGWLCLLISILCFHEAGVYPGSCDGWYFGAILTLLLFIGGTATGAGLAINGFAYWKKFDRS